MELVLPQGFAPLRAWEGLRHAAHRLAAAQRRVVARLGPGRLSAEEFGAYALANPGTTTAEALGFLGRRRALAWHAARVPAGWRAVVADRALAMRLAAGAGLPVPELLAVQAPPTHGFLPQTGQSLEDVLAEPLHHPLLAEPLTGPGPRLALLALAQGTLHLAHGGRLPLAEAMRLLGQGQGWMVQRRPRAHVALRAAFGLHALPVLHALVRDGSLLSLALTMDTPEEEDLVVGLDLGGRMLHARRGQGAEWRPVRRHQGTGALLPGRLLPHWEATAALIHRAAAVFRPFPLQCWELAISDEGPVLLRLAGGEALPLHQLAQGRGLRPGLTLRPAKALPSR